MSARPRTLRESVAIAPDATPAADPFGSESQEAKEAAEILRRGILVRVSPETRRALKLAEGTMKILDILNRAAAVCLKLPDGTVNADTERSYRRTFVRMWRDPTIDPLAPGIARGTYYYRRAALHRTQRRTGTGSPAWSMTRKLTWTLCTMSLPVTAWSTPGVSFANWRESEFS